MNAPAADTNNKQDTPERALMFERRRAIMLELTAIDKYLGLEPTVRALCPTCRKTWNKNKAA